MAETLLYYLIAINIVTFIVYGIDKVKAMKGKWRISEATLLLLAIIGGSVGAWLGMKTWHHKTMQFFKNVKGVTNVEYDHIIRLTDPVKPKLEIE